MGKENVAVATLLYSADYLPGVFTLGFQLRKLIDAGGCGCVKTCIVVTKLLYNDILSDISKNLLNCLYDDIVLVDPLDYQHITQDMNKENLKMLERPELSFALIKARIFELTQYEQVLYLDADTLPLNSGIFDLFDQLADQTSEQVAAVPDIGWPDIFNSGVMMIVPNRDVVAELNNYILNVVSIDGSDQGILNQFFNQNMRLNDFGRIANYSTKEWIRLPYLYNVTTPNYGYECPPAMKFFGSHIRLVHFIGKHKPWSKWSQEQFQKSSYAAQWRAAYLDFQIQYDLVDLLAHTTIKDEDEHIEPQQDECEEHIEENQPDEYHHEQTQYNERLEKIDEINEDECDIIEEEQQPIEKPPTPIQLPLDFKEWLTTFISKEDEEQQHNEEPSVEESQGNEPEETHFRGVHYEEHMIQHREEETINRQVSHPKEDAANEAAREIEQPKHRYDRKVEIIEEEDIKDHELDDLIDDESSTNKQEDDDEIVDEQEESRLASELEVKDSKMDVQESRSHNIHNQNNNNNYRFEWENTNYLNTVERSFPEDIFEYSVE